MLLLPVPTLAHAGPEYSDTYYLAMSGPGGAFPDFTNAKTQLGVAQALHGALNLPSSYPVSNIRTWLASQQAGSTTSGRHLLAADSLIILGYALAKEAGLPEPEALKAMVEDSSTLGVVAQGLADAGIVTQDFIKEVSVVMIAPDTNVTPQQIVKDIKSGALTPTPMSMHELLASITWHGAEGVSLTVQCLAAFSSVLLPLLPCASIHQHLLCCILQVT